MGEYTPGQWTRIDPRCPCKRDCENRRAGCHVDCEPWAVFKAIKAADYAEHQKKTKINEYFSILDDRIRPKIGKSKKGEWSKKR